MLRLWCCFLHYVTERWLQRGHLPKQLQIFLHSFALWSSFLFLFSSCSKFKRQLLFLISVCVFVWLYPYWTWEKHTKRCYLSCANNKSRHTEGRFTVSAKKTKKIIVLVGRVGFPFLLFVHILIFRRWLCVVWNALAYQKEHQAGIWNIPSQFSEGIFFLINVTRISKPYKSNWKAKSYSDESTVYPLVKGFQAPVIKDQYPASFRYVPNQIIKLLAGR